MNLLRLILLIFLYTDTMHSNCLCNGLMIKDFQTFNDSNCTGHIVSYIMQTHQKLAEKIADTEI